MQAVKIAVLGITGFSSSHLKTIKTLSQEGMCELKALVVINQNNLQEEIQEYQNQGVTIYSSLDEMFADSNLDIEAVFNPTGIPLHKPLSIQIMEAGYHVYCEKPISATIQDAQAMKEAQKKTGQIATIGYQSISSESYKIIKKRICNGEFGTVKSVKHIASWPRTKDYYERNGWAGKMFTNNSWVLDSPMHNALSHYLNAILYLGSNQTNASLTPKNVVSEMYRAKEIQSADTCCVKIETEENIDLLYFVTHSSDITTHPFIVIETEKATIESYNAAEHKIIYKDGRIEEHQTENAHESMVLDCFRSFFRTIREEQTQVDCTFEIAEKQVQVTNMAFESIKNTLLTFPENLIKTQIDENDKELTFVPELYEIMKKAFEQNCLIADLEDKPTWAEKGNLITLKDMKTFPMHEALQRLETQ